MFRRKQGLSVLSAIIGEKNALEILQCYNQSGYVICVLLGVTPSVPVYSSKPYLECTVCVCVCVTGDSG